MTIKDPTPHEQEALRVAEALDELGLWACASLIRARIESKGLHDDRDLRELLLSLGRTQEQIGESLGRVHLSIAAAAAQEQ